MNKNNGDELSKLRRERAKLEAQRDVDKAMAERQREKEQVKREIRSLKHRKTKAFFGSLGRGARAVGRGAVKAAKAADKAALKGAKRRKGGKRKATRRTSRRSSTARDIIGDIF